MQCNTKFFGANTYKDEGDIPSAHMGAVSVRGLKLCPHRLYGGN